MKKSLNLLLGSLLSIFSISCNSDKAIEVKVDDYYGNETQSEDYYAIMEVADKSPLRKRKILYYQEIIKNKKLLKILRDNEDYFSSNIGLAVVYDVHLYVFDKKNLKVYIYMIGANSPIQKMYDENIFNSKIYVKKIDVLISDFLDMRTEKINFKKGYYINRLDGSKMDKILSFIEKNLEDAKQSKNFE
ncbi:hypothetical protein AAEX28_00010 [Lentisphaerota bacterium WC36G]|nr:hypothetical protein LJT99_02885 [Lentisphaerae bacterium WC36]